jgi:hypothetical protein
VYVYVLSPNWEKLNQIKTNDTFIMSVCFLLEPILKISVTARCRIIAFLRRKLNDQIRVHMKLHSC